MLPAAAGTMASADVVIHCDLNKTLLAKDEVKRYGREEVVYLEQFKADADFLQWAHAQSGSPEDLAEWTRTLKLSKNEPELIALARQYCQPGADPTGERLAAVADTLAKIDKNDCVESFWRLLEWIQSPENTLRFLIVFRTFGIDMPEMFHLCEGKGYAGNIARNERDEPLIWRMLHKAESLTAHMGGRTFNALDIVDGYIQPGNAVPGPKDKHTPAFHERTLLFEEAAAAQAAAGEGSPVFVYTASPDVVEGLLGPVGPAVDPAHVSPVMDVPALFQGVDFGADKLRFMGIQDSYKPWSRKNWLNGKSLVMPDPALPAPFVQLAFDDYSFTKGDDMGTYIYALYDHAGYAITGTKTELQARYSAEPEFADVEGNIPSIFTVVLNKRGVANTAVGNRDYFLARVQRVLAKVRLGPR